MTRREAFNHPFWAAYARDLADRMGLKDWRVTIHDDAPDSADAVAACECLYGQKYATIDLSDAFFADSEENQRHTMTHELIHCHLAGLQHFHEKVLEGHDAEAARLFLEYAVDGFTETIAPTMPLPSEAKSSE